MASPLTVYAGSGDNRVYAGPGTWATVRAAANGVSLFTIIGAYGALDTGDYYINRAFLPFDTSAIPDDATVTGATLYLCGYLLIGTGEVTHIVSTSLTAMDGVEDYKIANYGTASAGSFAAAPTVDQYYNSAIDLAKVTVSKTGSTYIGLRGASDLNNSAPGGANYAKWYDQETGGPAKGPYLVVTYTEAGGYPTPHIWWEE